eukprot:UN24242
MKMITFVFFESFSFIASWFLLYFIDAFIFVAFFFFNTFLCRFSFFASPLFLFQTILVSSFLFRLSLPQFLSSPFLSFF